MEEFQFFFDPKVATKVVTKTSIVTKCCLGKVQALRSCDRKFARMLPLCFLPFLTTDFEDKIGSSSFV
jgi:hypothetical protein